MNGVPHDAQVHRDRGRAESFGSQAAQYDRARPPYPDVLIVDLLTRGPQSALDVGCGTGKAARLLADRGLPVLGVEADAAMAEVARRHGIEVEVARFETWDDAGRRFDLLTCGQAWHWVDPQSGPVKARQVLRPGGTIALFWNMPRQDEDVRGQLIGVYERLAPQLVARELARAPDDGDNGLAGQLTDAGFGDVTTRAYPWEHRYSTSEWLELIATYSDHHLVEPDARATLFQAVREVIDGHGGWLDVHYTTRCVLARSPA
jgi:SAM-dependent methyltransferase